MKHNAVKILTSFVVLIMIVYHIFQGHLTKSTLCFIHVVGGCAVLYFFYKDHSLQKKAAKLWIGITSLFPFVAILAQFYQLLLGNKGPGQYDVDSWASIYILSIPLMIGVVSYILVSKYLLENKKQITV